MKLRFFLLSSFFLLLFGALGVQLYNLQITKNNYYISRVQARGDILQEFRERRGEILITDRYGNDIQIALNRDFPIVFANPREIIKEGGDPERVAAQLAPIIGWEESTLRDILDNPNSLFRLLVGKASSSVVQAVSDLGIKGIFVRQHQYRFYPYEHLASQVLGFVGVNENTSEPTGLYGVEKIYNETLAQGSPVRLTLDRSIQAKAEEMLAGLMDRFDATGGTIIVQDPTSGRLLALANAPHFDPNSYGDFPVSTFINPAVQYVYEPGSVFKPITMAAGIDLGVITPETEYVDYGSLTLNGKTIHNARDQVFGRITMTNVLEHSVNTGAVFAAQQIGHEQFRRYVGLFGFGDRSNIDLPDEVPGSLRNLEPGRAKDIDFATASFGQGTSVTPVQLVTAYSALANGGLLMRPYLGKDKEPLVVRRVIDKKTAEQVTSMMEKTVEGAGVAVISGYRVAGKTGTALIPDFQYGGYSEEMIHTFVGFAPASKPAFTVLIKLDKPKIGDLAGRTVVPAFRDLAQYLLNYYNIAPDALSSPAENTL